MGDDVNSFRLRAIHCHLNIDNYMDMIISHFIFKTASETYSGGSFLNALILDNMDFGRKIHIIEDIFKESRYNQFLTKIYSNKFIFNNKKSIVNVEITEGKSFKISELIKHLYRINNIRNHLAHTLVSNLDKREDLTEWKNTTIDMNLYGDESQLNQSHEFAAMVLSGLR